MSDMRTGRPWWTRRGFLQGGAAIMAGVYGLPGRLGYAAEIPDQFDGSKFQLSAPEPNPKRGAWRQPRVHDPPLPNSPCGRSTRTSSIGRNKIT